MQIKTSDTSGCVLLGTSTGTANWNTTSTLDAYNITVDPIWTYSTGTALNTMNLYAKPGRYIPVDGTPGPLLFSEVCKNSKTEELYKNYWKARHPNEIFTWKVPTDIPPVYRWPGPNGSTEAGYVEGPHTPHTCPTYTGYVGQTASGGCIPSGTICISST